MATRRRIGVSAASTEAARRQLMQPVTCWEKVWVTPDGVPTTTSMKVYKWVKTERLQQFSDDEGGVDEPLAPLPDEPEVQEGDEEMEQDETETQTAERAATLDANSKAPSPKPSQPVQDLDVPINPQIVGLGDEDDNKVEPNTLSLDISSLGPDGLQLESAQDLSQLDDSDALLGAGIMDTTLDPFVQTDDK